MEDDMKRHREKTGIHLPNRKSRTDSSTALRRK
jgi:hypothetical protein